MTELKIKVNGVEECRNQNQLNWMTINNFDYCNDYLEIEIVNHDEFYEQS